MPNYRIPNKSAYALPSNWWKGDANGVWDINAVQRARKGDEWPPEYILSLIHI